MDCCHSKKSCTLSRSDGDYGRVDVCTECKTQLKCEHFKVQKQVIRYGRDRYKPSAVVNAIDEFTEAFNEFDFVDY